MTKILFLLIAFITISVTNAKIYSKCEFARELYLQHRLEKDDIGYHMCAARSYSGYNTQYNTGNFLSIYRIGTQWWCGKNGPGGLCNVKCSNLIDDYLADDIKCFKEIIRVHGVSTWGLDRDKCDQDFNEMEQCLRNVPPPKETCDNINVINTCGRPFQIRGAIIGGSKLSQSQRGSYPWLTALIYTTNEYFCGGVLISKNKVLTAAHCMLPKGSTQQLLPKDIRTLLGVYNLDDPFEVGRSAVAIEKIRMHPDWNPNTQRYEGDIAMLHLESDVQFSRFIQPICLIPKNTNVLAFNEGIVVGYGIGSATSKTSEKIPKIIKLPIHKNEDCYRHNKEFAGISSSNTFCAGVGKGSGVCSGDSGSGLYIKSGDTYFLRGIVSASFFTSEGTCDVNDYAIFTSVTDYYNFVTGF